MRLEGRRVLLVGVSAGLGAATAYYLLKEGASVVISERDDKKLSNLVEMLSPYGRISGIRGDASTPNGAKKLVQDAVKSLGRIDDVAVLVGGYIEDHIENLKGIDQMIHNHIKIPLYVASASLPHLHKGSSMVLVSSMAGLEGYSDVSYSIGKAGTAKAVHTLAAELLKRGIRVNGIAPSWIAGDFKPERDWKRARKLGDYKAPPDDFARVLVWLMTDEAEWVDGVVIPVDGGTRFRG